MTKQEIIRLLEKEDGEEIASLLQGPERFARQTRATRYLRMVLCILPPIAGITVISAITGSQMT